MQAVSKANIFSRLIIRCKLYSPYPFMAKRTRRLTEVLMFTTISSLSQATPRSLGERSRSLTLNVTNV